jgi:hypothetical protein
MQCRQRRIIDLLYGPCDCLIPAYLDLSLCGKIPNRGGVGAHLSGRKRNSAIQIVHADFARQSFPAVLDDNAGQVAVGDGGTGRAHCHEAGQTTQ